MRAQKHLSLLVQSIKFFYFTTVTQCKDIR
jgi:hypothetical protein